MPRHLLAMTLPLLLVMGACTTAEPDTAAGPDATASAPDTAASTPPATGTPGAPPSQPGCNAEAARNVVGQLASTEMVEQARSAAGAESARTLKPGQMVTMEYNASRLNIDVDAGNIITNVRCG